MTKQDLGVTRRISEYAAATRYEALPPEVGEFAKMCILDSLCSIIVGRPLLAGECATRYAQQAGGREEATIIGTTIKGSAETATFVNGMTAHADEIDDVGESHYHPGAAVVPPVLALAEKLGSSGREVINAVVLGYDICGRVTRAIGPQRWLINNRHTLNDSFLGMGSAAASARLLGLSVEQHRHCFGLAQMYVGATMAYMDERWHIAKAMSLGKSAHIGVHAATLAAIGFQSNDSVFEGRNGVLETWAGDEPPELLEQGLGSSFDVGRTHFKFYSAGHPIHSPVHTILRLMREHNLQAADLAQVDLHVTTYAASIVADRDTPSICLQDMVAVAAVLGKLGVKEAHEESNFTLPAVCRLREVITVKRDPDMDARDAAGFGARVRVRTTDGRQLEDAQELPPGDYREQPRAGWTELEGKFRENCGHLMPAAALDDVPRLVRALDDAANLSALMAALAYPSN